MISHASTHLKNMQETHVYQVHISLKSRSNTTDQPTLEKTTVCASLAHRETSLSEIVSTRSYDRHLACSLTFESLIASLSTAIQRLGTRRGLNSTTYNPIAVIKPWKSKGIGKFIIDGVSGLAGTLVSSLMHKENA